MFWNSWEDILRIFVIALLGYAGLVVMLRISGNRTLSKMNSFDLVITVAFGSTFAAGVLQKAVSLASLLFAFFMLIVLQYVVTWLSVRSPRFESLVKTDPTLLYKDGKVLRGALRKTRVTEKELRAAARESGYLDLSQIQAMFIESDGALTCIAAAGRPEGSEGSQAGADREPDSL